MKMSRCAGLYLAISAYAVASGAQAGTPAPDVDPICAAIRAIAKVISLCIDAFLVFGILRAGVEMYMGMKTPTAMQLAVFQLASLALIWLLVAIRRGVMRKM